MITGYTLYKLKDKRIKIKKVHIRVYKSVHFLNFNHVQVRRCLLILFRVENIL